MPRIARAITQFTKREVATLFKTARRVSKHDELTILQAPGQGTIGRILIIIPKKVGNAPTRNKLRRQIKAIFYEQRFYEKEFDWAVILRPAAKTLTFAQLKKYINSAFEASR